MPPSPSNSQRWKGETLSFRVTRLLWRSPRCPCECSNLNVGLHWFESNPTWPCSTRWVCSKGYAEAINVRTVRSWDFMNLVVFDCICHMVTWQNMEFDTGSAVQIQMSHWYTLALVPWLVNITRIVCHCMRFQGTLHHTYVRPGHFRPLLCLLFVWAPETINDEQSADHFWKLMFCWGIWRRPVASSFCSGKPPCRSPVEQETTGKWWGSRMTRNYGTGQYLCMFSEPPQSLKACAHSGWHYSGGVWSTTKWLRCRSDLNAQSSWNVWPPSIPGWKKLQVGNIYRPNSNFPRTQNACWPAILFSLRTLCRRHCKLRPLPTGSLFGQHLHVAHAKQRTWNNKVVQETRLH